MTSQNTGSSAVASSAAESDAGSIADSTVKGSRSSSSRNKRVVQQSINERVHVVRQRGAESA